MPGDANLVKVETKVLEAVVQELNKDLRDINAWLMAAIKNAGDMEFYHARVGDIPVGTDIHLWLANVDDHARVRFEGYMNQVAGNADPLDTHRRVEVAGNNAIILELINTYSGESRCDFRVGVPGRGWVVQLERTMVFYDLPPIGKQRNFIYTFRAVPGARIEAVDEEPKGASKPGAPAGISKGFEAIQSAGGHLLLNGAKSSPQDVAGIWRTLDELDRNSLKRQLQDTQLQIEARQLPGQYIPRGEGLLPVVKISVARDGSAFDFDVAWPKKLPS